MNIRNGKQHGGVRGVPCEPTMMELSLVVFLGMHISRLQFVSAWLLDVRITGYLS